MSQSTYNADALEVLSGLDPVRRRPGMYTDTTRPNHLAQEVARLRPEYWQRAHYTTMMTLAMLLGRSAELFGDLLSNDLVRHGWGLLVEAVEGVS